MRLRLPRRRLWRVTIYLASFWLMLTAADLLLVQIWRTIHPGFETTRIIGPIGADGSIDYLAAIEDQAGAGVTPQNNAAVPILQALGRIALAPQQPTDGITNRLGMPPLPEKGNYFVQYADYCKTNSLSPQKDLVDPDEITEPIVVATSIGPAARQWVDANQTPLASLLDASNRSRFFMPCDGGYRADVIAETILAYLKPMRDVQRPLLTRALIRLDSGDFPGFREDLLAAHRLARLLGQGPFMFDRATAAGMETSSCRVGRLAANSGKLSADQARSLANDLASLGDLPPILDPMNAGERYIELDALQYLARVGPLRAGQLLISVMGPHNAVFQPAVFLFVPLPYERMMRGTNHLDDGTLVAARLPTYPQRLAAMKLRDQNIQGGGLGNTLTGIIWGEWPTRWFIPPSIVRPTQKEFDAKMENRLTRVALELSAYKSDHGVYPDALEELSPVYFRELPGDLFSEKPLVYSTRQGHYSLYSVGPNMLDDGETNDDIPANFP